MKKNLETYSDSSNCPVRNVLDRFGDKWSILVILILNQEENVRFNQLHKTIGAISQKMLTVTLKNLQADGLIVRQAYLEIPPRVEYKLTDLGKSLVPHITNLTQWADENMPVIMESRENYKNCPEMWCKSNTSRLWIFGREQ